MSSRFLTSNGPLDPGHMMRTLGIHAIPTLDIHELAKHRHTRVIAVDSGPKAVELEFTTNGVQLSCPGANSNDLDQIEPAVRAWLDLDTDLSRMQEPFSLDPTLGPLVKARPWLRLVGYLNGFEAAATTVLGQQVTLAEEWCFGYTRAVAICNWPALPVPQALLLQAIADCAEQDNFELPEDLDVAAHQQSVAAIAPAARALHDFWSSQR